MASESQFLLHALSMGFFITFVYDILRVLRRVFPHGRLLVSLEDIGFWIYCAAKVFVMMYRESNGTMRWFAVLGALAGMLLYRKLVSPCFVKYASLLLRKICLIAVKTAAFLSKPLRLLARKLRERVAKIAKRCAVKRQKRRELRKNSLKKKLTFLLRMVKMNM